LATLPGDLPTIDHAIIEAVKIKGLKIKDLIDRIEEII